MERWKLMIAAIATFACLEGAMAQIPAEAFAGHQKATFDVMFFKYFKGKNGEQSKWLFFNRVRASVDYKMTSATRLPSIGLTEAFSYNHPALKGFAPVGVVQIFGSGVFAKAGVQYVRLRREWTVFSWLVSEIAEDPGLDYFLLVRYTPAITDKLNLFTQFESLNTFPTLSGARISLTQRVRLGLKAGNVQFGAGADFSEAGRKVLSRSDNLGGFLRYEF